MNKIDPIIIDKVHTMDTGNNSIDCIVYATNYPKVKKYITKVVNPGVITELPFISAFGISISYNGIVSLSKIKSVKYISSVSKVSACMDKANAFLGTTNMLVNNSANISVAVIDTGCSPHIDLMMPKRIIHFVDLVNDKKHMYDDNGHGTFVTGVVAGSGAYSGGKYGGVDKDIGVVVVKALDNNGEAGALNILRAMQWVLEHKDDYNIRVVCMSFGSTPLGMDDPLLKGAEVLWDSGVTVVSAAGNSGPDSSTIKSPGISSKIITVGALDISSMQVANFSSRGPTESSYKPDVLAPGVNVVGLNHKLRGYPYTTMSGTSVATPMIAAIASNIIKKHTSISPNRVKSIITSMCTPLTGDRNAEGYGYYDKNKS